MRRRPARNLTVVMVDKKVGGYEHDLAYAPVASALTHLVDLPNCVGVFASIPYALAAVGLGPTERVAAGPEPVQAALVAVRDRAAAVARARYGLQPRARQRLRHADEPRALSRSATFTPHRSPSSPAALVISSSHEPS